MDLERVIIDQDKEDSAFLVEQQEDLAFEEVEKPNPASVSLVIVGRAGVGKTALANAISKVDVGIESSGLDDNLTDFHHYSINRPGVDMEICDCPGLQGSSTDGHFMTTLKEKVNQCDVVIYCMRIDAVRLEKMDVENINLISQSLGVDFWDKTVVALTFANLVTSPPCFQADGAIKVSWLTQRAQDWQTELRSRLYEAGIPEDVADKIPLVSVGYNKPTMYFSNPWTISCDKNWLLTFMLAMNEKLENGPLIVIIDELRSSPSENMTESGDLVTESVSRLKISAQVGAAIGAGVGASVGVAAGAMLAGPVVAAAGGVAGAVGGATLVYSAMGRKKQKDTHPL